MKPYNIIYRAFRCLAAPLRKECVFFVFMYIVFVAAYSRIAHVAHAGLRFLS